MPPDTLAPCPQCRSTDVLMTCTDLHADPQRGDMVYRLRCTACGFRPRWEGTQAQAVRHWQRLRRPHTP